MDGPSCSYRFYTRCHLDRVIDKNWDAIVLFNARLSLLRQKKEARLINEHPPPGVVLLCCAPWRHHRSSAQHSIWHSAAGRQRASGAVGAIPGGDLIPAASVCADT